jgi:hypothetical protein
VAEGETPSQHIQMVKVNKQIINLNSKIIADLRQSNLTLREFIKRYGMKGRR